ncbi:hypothetical protein [uncultured Algibacter sp.]|uniref:hypothetical protein n=1 Tax=uncultured Algibacter sp. TaxID=298659 RepID=UPI0032171442
MKSIFFLLFILMLSSCSGNSDVERNCNFLLDINVQVSIDLNLPQYGQLAFAGNSVYIPNVGNAGVIVASTGADFFAWDASDPNHAPNDCSAIIPNGLNGSCGCNDGNTYNFITGTPQDNDGLRCSLRNYRIEQNGSILNIFN